MGRRSRKRMSADEPAVSATTRAERDEARRRRAGARDAAPGKPVPRGARDGRPPAPWGNFPLSELLVLLALVLGIAGFVVWGDRGRWMVLAAMALGSLAGLELSIREHYAGYRSHSALLAGFTAFAVCTVILIAFGGAGIAIGAVLIVGAVVFGGAFYALRQLFRLKSGGLGFR